MPVNSQHADYKRFLPKWERCRDVAAGEDAVHEAGPKYLPRLKEQSEADYEAYVKRAPFYNATWRTIAGLVGMVFRRPPKVEVPDAVAPLLDDANGAGLPFQLLLQYVAEEALKVGRLAVLVDHPPAPDGTRADSIRLGLRPTIVTYDAFSVINWKTETVDGKRVLTQLVLHECEYVAEDEFTGKDEDRWRVLDLVEGAPGGGRRYRQRVFRLQKGAPQGSGSAEAQFAQVGEDIYPTMSGKNLGFIPAVVMSSDDASVDCDDPPLIDLANMNLSHYRTKADHEHGCHFTALPTLVLTGWRRDTPTDKIYLGSETALVTAAPEAKASFVEFSGAGLSALEKNLDSKEKQMAVLGARMLEPQTRYAEANDTANTHRKGEEAMLSSVSQNISLVMTQALKWFVEWAGADPAGALVELNRKFYTAQMSPQALSAMVVAWQQGAPGFSDQCFFDQMKSADLVPEDLKLEDEQARIADRAAELAALVAPPDAGGGQPGGQPGGAA